LDEEVTWDNVLSGGERQRFGFARLLSRGKGIDLAIMDECTSALDVATEDNAYGLLRANVGSFVSVSHHPRLETFHTHKLSLTMHGDGYSVGALQKL